MLSGKFVCRLLPRAAENIRNYEKALPVTPVLGKIASLAVAQGLTDVAAELRTDARVTPASKPPPPRIRNAEYKTGAATPPVDQRLRKRYLHTLLDEVFQSGSQEAVTAAENNIVLFAKYARRAEAEWELPRKKA